MTDEADDLARLHLEIYILESPQNLRLRVTVAAQALERRAQDTGHGLSQTRRALLQLAYKVLLA
jgi:hypothetical protein